MEHNPDWLHARKGVNKAVRIYLCYAENGSLIGYAPFFLHPSTLSFELFGISLFEYSIRRYTITTTPLLSEAEGSAELLSTLFGELSKSLNKRAAPPANSNNIYCEIKFMNFLRNLYFETKSYHLTQVSFFKLATFP
jgi:hypothetical protein